MARLLDLAAVQAPPLAIGAPLAAFESDLNGVLAASPGVQLVVYPELHLFGTAPGNVDEVNRMLSASAVCLEDQLIDDLGAIAREAGVWLLPGSICERGRSGELFNTALVFSPAGTLVASYRKIFPWRPFEPYDPGDRFVVFDMDGVGRLGLSICYDAWFPEVTRHLAWMGAEAVLNIVKTTTPDREQELVLARANSIANQNFTVSVNCAGPVGKGKSLVIDPEGAVLDEIVDDRRGVLHSVIDLDAVTAVRTQGTAGLNRMWSQFLPTDTALPLPLYGGSIDPQRWQPRSTHPTE